MICLPFHESGEWKPVSRVALFGWLAFYTLFLLHAWTDDDGFLLLDHANLIIHEAGHFFFRWFGYIPTILGGTLMELLVPALLGVHFWVRRETTAVAFCSFWFFENFTYIGRYMADARVQMLPLVGAGDHDWEILFAHWNLLHRDRAIGGAFTFLGWIGVLATVAWLLWMHRKTNDS